MILAMVVAKAGSIAIGSAEDGSQRQKLLHVATFSVSAALIAFGITYSDHLSKEDSSATDDGSERRRDAILTTLLAGWWYEQAVGFGTVILRFGLYWGCYFFFYKPLLQDAKSAGAAAVHPHGGYGLDASIMKTDGVKEGVGKLVAVEEITLQLPMQECLLRRVRLKP
ncbi:unnamed protein product [Phytophthora lilii]|uniref:Unnamed protein product n=1 Tax=Phytophthora lilii TaxID=2077276 RepID=A0A9W6WNK0_9STRA|nr:unnamed protein product [Phytophthora lilii]